MPSPGPALNQTPTSALSTALSNSTSVITGRAGEPLLRFRPIGGGSWRLKPVTRRRGGWSRPQAG